MSSRSYILQIMLWHQSEQKNPTDLRVKTWGGVGLGFWRRWLWLGGLRQGLGGGRGWLSGGVCPGGGRGCPREFVPGGGLSVLFDGRVLSGGVVFVRGFWFRGVLPRRGLTVGGFVTDKKSRLKSSLFLLITNECYVNFTTIVLHSSRTSTRDSSWTVVDMLQTRDTVPG